MYCVNMKEVCNFIRIEVNIMAENDQYLKLSSDFLFPTALFCVPNMKESNAGLDNMIK